MHDVPGVDEAQADAAADRRGDAGICQLQLGVVDLTLIGRDSAIKLPNQRGLSVELLLGDHAFLEKKLEALKIDFRIFALCLVFSELPQRLPKLYLERPRIDLREKISLVDELAFLERDTDELTIDTAANRDGVEGSDGAKSIEINGQIAALRSGNNDRHNHAACAEASLAFARRCGRTRVGCLAGVLRAAVIPTTQSYNAECESPEPPAAPGRRGGRRAARARLGKV